MTAALVAVALAAPGGARAGPGRGAGAGAAGAPARRAGPAERQERRARAAERERERAQERLDREEERYERGTEALDEERWDQAIEAFDRVAQSGGRRADAALYWKAYAQRKAGRPADALATLAQLRKTAPQSKYLKEADNLEQEIRQSSGQPPCSREASRTRT